MNVNLTYNELQALNDLLDFVTEQKFINVDPETEVLLWSSQAKVKTSIEDSWRPLSELPPLNHKVIVRDNDCNLEVEMVRKELASSYSPEILVMHHTNGKPFELISNLYSWRLI